MTTTNPKRTARATSAKAHKKPGTVVPNAAQKRFSSGLPALTAPSNGPGYTLRPLPKIDAPAQADYPKYDGAELRPNPGLTADRFEAFNLPSLVNGVRMPPKRITAMCVGAAGPVQATTGSQRRFTQ